MSKTQHTYITGKDGVTVYINGTSYTISASHQNYSNVIDAIKEGKSSDFLLDLMDTKKAITSYCQGSIEIKAGVLYYQGDEIRNSLTIKILQMMEEGFSISPMVQFLKNLRQNPSRVAQQELYDFLEAGNLPITPDGCFLAYKSVNQDYKDYHSRKFDNSIGSVCEMPRNAVCDDRNITCSHGLHFAQKSYAEGFGRGGHLMVLKVNPADVVSIPRDYKNTKGRCSKYEVIGETPYSLKDDKFVEKAVYQDQVDTAIVCSNCHGTFMPDDIWVDDVDRDCCPHCQNEI